LNPLFFVSTLTICQRKKLLIDVRIPAEEEPPLQGFAPENGILRHIEEDDIDFIKPNGVLNEADEPKSFVQIGRAIEIQRDIKIGSIRRQRTVPSRPEH
jgi:hypothetical protein